MFPSYQGLKSCELSIFQRDNRLVKHTEFIAFQRASLIRFHLQQLNCLCMLCGIENVLSGFALSLYSIHRRVGVTQNIFRMLVTTEAGCDAYAASREHLVPAQIQWFSQSFLKPLGQRSRFANPLNSSHEDRKFITTQTSNNVIF